jgi:flagellar protein FliJ
MNSLKSIIRLHKWQLDEKRRELVELQTLHEHLLGQIARLEEEMERERETARADLEASFTFANYAKAARERRHRLDQSVAQVDEQIQIATDAVAEAYQELKKYELAEEERVKREALKLKRKQDAILDETASIGFRRRQQEESEQKV